VLRPHPPERLVRALARGEVAACCCCCCCLHSLGSLAGAIFWSFDQDDSPDPRGKEAPPVGLRDDELDGPAAAAPARPRPGPVAATIFWWSTVALTVLTIVVPPLIRAENGRFLGIRFENGRFLGIGLLILFLPAVLLGGAAVSALVLAGTPSRCEDIREWKRLGGITLGIVVGALFGWISLLPFF
jgi:hypothetical protein